MNTDTKEQAQHSYEVKPIPGFNGYLASSVGDIISSSHDWRGKGERVMTQTINQHGYPTVRLQIGRKRQVATVHKLVLLAFRGSPETGFEARHLNGIRHDNRLENLQWGTRTENAVDREMHGNTARGPEHSDIIRASLRERQQAAEKLIVASVNHAGKLAEALLEIRNTIAANGGKNVSLDWVESKCGDALAAYEEGQ